MRFFQAIAILATVILAIGVLPSLTSPSSAIAQVTFRPGEVVVVQNDQAESTAAPDDLAVDPEFAKAINSLDDSMNYEPEKELDVRNRLVSTALIGGMLLGLMGVLFSYLRLEHATRGFYSGRLQTLAIALAIAIFVLGYILWSQVLF